MLFLLEFLFMILKICQIILYSLLVETNIIPLCSSYMISIKFTLIFGVATTLHVVHRSLTFDATAKLRFEVFRTQSQSKTLTDILEGTLLNPIIPFKLIGQTYGLLIDSFLCDDFSVNQFIQNFKVRNFAILKIKILK